MDFLKYVQSLCQDWAGVVTIYVNTSALEKVYYFASKVGLSKETLQGCILSLGVCLRRIVLLILSTLHVGNDSLDHDEKDKADLLAYMHEKYIIESSVIVLRNLSSGIKNKHYLIILNYNLVFTRMFVCVKVNTFGK